MIHHVDYHDDGMVEWYECWEFEPPPKGSEYTVEECSWNDDYDVRTIHKIVLHKLGSDD